MVLEWGLYLVSSSRRSREDVILECLILWVEVARSSKSERYCGRYSNLGSSRLNFVNEGLRTLGKIDET